MRMIESKKIAFGLLATAALAITVLSITCARELSVRRRVRAITSIQSLGVLAEQLGIPDAVHIVPTDIQDIPLSLVFDYYDPTFSLLSKSKFPFIKSNRGNQMTRVHILGLDKLSQLPQINENLLKSYWEYHHAVVPKEYKYEIPLDLTGDRENSGRYKSQLEQIEQNIGLQIDAAARRD